MITSMICQGLFMFILAAGSFYFTTAKRRTDWYCVAFASAAIYFLPGILGETSIPGETLPVSDLCYFVMSLVMGSLWCSAIMYDLRMKANQAAMPAASTASTSAVSENYFALTATLLQSLGCLYAIQVSGTALLSQSKHEMAQTFTQFHLLWLMGAPTAFIVSVFYRRYLLSLINFVSMLGILFIGSRTQLAIGVIGAITILLARRGVHPIIRHKKTCMTVVAFVCFVFLYKQCYIALKAGDIEGASTRLSERWADAFLSSEPVAIQHILNVVVLDDYRLPAYEYISRSFLAQVSGAYTSKEASFGDIATYDIFGDLGYGMASNIWAEMYAYGGLVGVGIFLLIYNGMIRFSQVSYRHDLLQIFFACFMPWWCFYIHRNDIYRMLSFSKQLIAFLVVMAVMSLFVRLVYLIYFGKTHSVRMTPAAMPR
ncbi:MAG: hypothetical protein KDA78_11395 [Planctomycetaceae bacterium]|nr:hypothetical protein [Planctomycetaceae bacterium]